MVNRPPPKPGGGPSGREDSDGSSSNHSQRNGGLAPRRGLEWSLRSLHKIDTSAQHFLSNYYGADPDDVNAVNGGLSGRPGVILEDQTAFEIFKTDDLVNKPPGVGGGSSAQDDKVWAALHAPLRTGVVDGKKVVFELLSDVTQKPSTCRKDRLKRRHEIINADRSSREVRLRFWLMHFSLFNLTWSFLAVFIGVNVIFAGFFYAYDAHCCGDATMTFGDVFAFSIQTSTTIGYGSFSPDGAVANFLVVMLYYISTLINTLFAGLLFTKFVTPVVNIQCSDVMTLCNVNGVPCLSVRLGNPDGYANPLTDINVRLTYSYQIPYVDHKGEQRNFRQTEELKLLSNRKHGLLECWSLLHVVDENSPLFGLHFEEHPANKIYIFTLSVDAVQNLTKSSVNVQTEYALEDILIGHSFKSMAKYDDDARVAVSDYSRISETDPYPVWYPAKTGVHDTEERVPPRKFGAH